MSPSCLRVVVVALLVVQRFFRRRPTIAAAGARRVCGGSGRGGLFRQFEYEEEMYLSLDGSATIFVNSSVPALNALRGTSFDARPNARLDRAAVRQYYTHAGDARHPRELRRAATTGCSPTSASMWTTSGAWASAAPFAWSSYQLVERRRPRRLSSIGGRGRRRGGRGSPGGTPARTGGVPAAPPERDRLPQQPGSSVQRGNILEWEQPLTDRLRGVPVTIEARMKPQSILYRTLLLFGGTLLAVAVLFGGRHWLDHRRCVL